ncbi:MAG: hypothetical protein ACRC0X_02335 [Brevinema sp.]
MIEFIRDLCDSDEEFLLIGLWLNKFVENHKNRYLYIPKSLTKKKGEKGKKHVNLRQLYKVIYTYAPHTAAFKIKSLMRNFGGVRMYVPVMGTFFRILRNDKFYKCRELGFSYQDLGILFGKDSLALRKLQYSQKRLKEE